MKKSYIIIGVVVIVMLDAIGIYAVINSNSQSKKQLEENSTNIEGTTNTENSTKENNTENKDEYIQNNQISNESEENNMYSTGNHHAEIVVKNYGTIVLELDADVAPITVENFLKLIDEDKSLLDNVAKASIGPITANTCKKHGLIVDVEADVYTIDGLVAKIKNFGWWLLMKLNTLRPRRLRLNSAVRDMVRENSLSVNDLIYPIFVVAGENV